MGHLMSKNQHLLPPATQQQHTLSSLNVQPTDEIEILNNVSISEQQQLVTSNRSLLLSSSAATAAICNNKPKSVVITIRMLKMEPNNSNNSSPQQQFNNFNCICHDNENSLKLCHHEQEQQNAVTISELINNCTQNHSTINNFNIIVSDINHHNQINGNCSANHKNNNNNCSLTNECNNVNNNTNNNNTSVVHNNININMHNNTNIICDTSNNHISTNNQIEISSSSSSLTALHNELIKLNNNAKISDTFKTNIQQCKVVISDQQHEQQNIDCASVSSSKNIPNINQIPNQNGDQLCASSSLLSTSGSVVTRNPSGINTCERDLEQSIATMTIGGLPNSLVDDTTACEHCQRKLPTTTDVMQTKWNRCCKVCGNFKEVKSNSSSNTSASSSSKTNKKGNWGLKLNCARLKGTKSTNNLTPTVSPQIDNDQPHFASLTNDSKDTSTAYQQETSQNVASQQQNLPSFNQQIVAANSSASNDLSSLTHQILDAGSSRAILIENPSRCSNVSFVLLSSPPILDFSRFNRDDYPIEDCDETARIRRAVEIARGVEPPPGFMPTRSIEHVNDVCETVPTSSILINSSTKIATPSSTATTIIPTELLQTTTATATTNSTNQLHMVYRNDAGCIVLPTRIHSQVDYIHCLVPDLHKITNCCFYWGKMDRYEAERLLDGKPEGTFLLRDSAQEEFLFSVSFRKYGRSLHARIEQFNHKFSFDCHDPGVYTSKTVTGLLNHYKDPACVMFFEPALTLPLNRNFSFSLQQLCRATIVSSTTYDGINDLTLPQTLKSYLKEYHYKQRVRVARFDTDDPFYYNVS